MQCRGTPACNKRVQFRCTGCSEAVYCSKDCQTKHYPIHARGCARDSGEHRVLAFDVDGTLTPYAGAHGYSLFAAYTQAMTAKAIATFTGPDARDVDSVIEDLMHSGATLFGVAWGEPLPYDTADAHFDANLVRDLYAHVAAVAASPRTVRLHTFILGAYILMEDPFDWSMEIVARWVDSALPSKTQQNLLTWLWDMYGKTAPRKFSVVSNSWRASVVSMLTYMGIDNLFNLSQSVDTVTGSIGSAFRTYERFPTDEPIAKMAMVAQKGLHWYDPTPATSASGAGRWRLVTPNAAGKHVLLMDQAISMGITSIVYVDDSATDITNMADMLVRSVSKQGPRFDLVKLFLDNSQLQMPQWIGVNETVGKLIADVFDTIAKTQEPYVIHNLHSTVQPANDDSDSDSEGYVSDAPAVWSMEELFRMGIHIE